MTIAEIAEFARTHPDYFAHVCDRGRDAVEMQRREEYDPGDEVEPITNYEERRGT